MTPAVLVRYINGMAREYHIGEPVEGFDVPEFLQTIQDDLQAVRERQSELSNKLYPSTMGRDYREPEPILQARIHQERDALDKEESRLQSELSEYVWLLPPLAEPPSNTLTQAKAKKILEHGEVHGQALTKAQKGFFGLIAGGGKPTRLKK